MGSHFPPSRGDSETPNITNSDAPHAKLLFYGRCCTATRPCGFGLECGYFPGLRAGFCPPVAAAAAKRSSGASCRLCIERAALTASQYSSLTSLPFLACRKPCRLQTQPSSPGRKKRCQTNEEEERKDAGRRLHRLRLADGPGEPVLQDPRLPRVPRSGRRRVRKLVRLPGVSR